MVTTGCPRWRATRLGCVAQSTPDHCASAGLAHRSCRRARMIPNAFPGLRARASACAGGCSGRGMVHRRDQVRAVCVRARVARCARFPGHSRARARPCARRCVGIFCGPLGPRGSSPPPQQPHLPCHITASSRSYSGQDPEFGAELPPFPDLLACPILPSPDHVMQPASITCIPAPA